MTPSRTSDEIVRIAREVLASEGLSGVSFDAIARRLGRSKQAVLYWYPTKHDLLAAMFLPCLEAEAETATRSVAGATGRSEAIGAYVRAIARFHLDDLDRFRLMYLLPQTIRQAAQEPHHRPLLDKVYPLTDRVYGSLARHLGGEPSAARRQAVAIHSAVLGLVLMFGLADNLSDPLKHDPAELIDALVAALQAA